MPGAVPGAGNVIAFNGPTGEVGTYGIELIGDANTIREFCTFNLGTVQDVGVTRLGDRWFEQLSAPGYSASSVRPSVSRQRIGST